jgi:hypothetical protein
MENMFVTVKLLHGTGERRGRKRERWRASGIIKPNICEGRGDNDMY